LNIDFGINNERQDCKIGTVWVVTVRERVNEGDEGGNMVNGLHIHV
jgi:hypothetical protein